MRKRGGPVGTTLAVSIALALTACVPSPHTVTPTPEATATPVFASDAQALAAAKAAYEGYLAASDQIGNDGGRDPERISKWVAPGRLPEEVKIFLDFAKTGHRLIGRSSFFDFRLQSLSHAADGSALLAAYVCDDVSRTKVVDATGADITPKLRPRIVPLQVRFKNLTGAQFLVEGSEPWSGEDFCL
jgi:hypothetical protein